MDFFFAMVLPRGFLNERCVVAFASAAERDAWIAAHNAATPECALQAQAVERRDVARHLPPRRIGRFDQGTYELDVAQLPQPHLAHMGGSLANGATPMQSIRAAERGQVWSARDPNLDN